MPSLVDSHVHLDDARFDDDRDQVVARARAAGVDLQIVPSVDRQGWPRVAALSREYPDVHGAYGLHPVFLRNHRDDDVQALDGWLAHHAAVAVGEIGLDHYVEGLDPDRQKKLFLDQLAIARSHGLPVIVHARRAVEEVILALRRQGGLRGVVHSFAGSPEQARQLLDLDFHLGIGGPVTYPRARRLRRIVADLPIERLLLETDAPDQPGTDHRGQRNEPAWIHAVLEQVAMLREEDPAYVAGATSANARHLFGLAGHTATPD